jgi:monoamine oxidase
VTWQGGWVGADVVRGHALRDAFKGTQATALHAPDTVRDVSVLVLGGGVGGLAAARAVMQAGVDDVQVLELDDVPGGNARSHEVMGSVCALGAHYVPVPNATMPEMLAWFETLGLMHHNHGRWHANERHLCHAPQERLLFEGEWIEGLLPPAEPRSKRLAQYRNFSEQLATLQRQLKFHIPIARAPWTPAHAALDQQTFAAWLASRGLDDEALLGYLDYACRDDYGAGIACVSAWAGLHYFASRHGFRVPDASDTTSEVTSEVTSEGVFTWPEGNAWLTTKLAAPLGSRLVTGQAALRLQDDARGQRVEVDVLDVKSGRAQRFRAQHVVVALPLHVASPVIQGGPTALREGCAQLARSLTHSPWLVANVALRSGLDDRTGAAPAWDNVAFARAGTTEALGYVDASHQSFAAHRSAKLLTAYWAFGHADSKLTQQRRQALLDEPWSAWSARVVQALSAMHPDLLGKVQHVDLARYGHAMAVPRPGLRSQLVALGLHRHQGASRVHLAHSDLAGYSVFEEAFALGHAAGERVAAALRG